jgi:hypothetical protein
LPRPLWQRTAVVEGVIGTDEFVLSERVEQGRKLRTLELGRNA